MAVVPLGSAGVPLRFAAVVALVADVAVVALVAVAALPPTLHEVQVPVRFVIVPDDGVPSAPPDCTAPVIRESLPCATVFAVVP